MDAARKSFTRKMLKNWFKTALSHRDGNGKEKNLLKLTLKLSHELIGLFSGISFFDVSFGNITKQIYSFVSNYQNLFRITTFKKKF